MQLIKPCVQSADNQNREETQRAVREIWHDSLCFCYCFVFLRLALVSARCLLRVEGRYDVNSSLLLSQMCLSPQQGLNDIWLIPWCFCEQSRCTWSWTIQSSVKLWLNTESWAHRWLLDGKQSKQESFMQIYTFAHGNVLDYQPGLDQANRHGTFMVLLWLYVTKKCLCSLWIKHQKYIQQKCKLPLLMLRKNLCFIPIMVFATTSLGCVVSDLFKCNTEKFCFLIKVLTSPLHCLLLFWVFYYFKINHFQSIVRHSLFDYPEKVLETFKLFSVVHWGL